MRIGQFASVAAKGGVALALLGSNAFSGNIVSSSQAFPISEIYYEIVYLNPSNQAYKASVVSALRYWESKTNLTFIPKRTNWVGSNAPKVIRFQEMNTALAYCSSNVGQNGGLSTVQCNIAKSGSLRHEIGHAIGFYHEHSRSDRGSHIYVGPCPPYNVNGTWYYDWEALNTSGPWGSSASWDHFQNDYCPTEGNNFGSYDRLSIMHYPRKPSEDYFIRPRGSNWSWQTLMNAQAVENSGSWMVGSATLSSGDISAANALYPVNGASLYTRTNETMYGTTNLMVGSFLKVMQSGNRIGVLTTGAILYVKEGISGNWVDEGLQNVIDFDLEGDRIGALTSDGLLRVKEGGLSASWVTVEGAVTQFDLEGNRIGVLRTNSELKVKEGGLSDTWIPETSGVTKFRLEDERIGVLFTNGKVSVKEGGLSAVWVNDVFVGATDFFLEDDIIMAKQNSRLYAKRGGISATWKDFGNIFKVSAANDRMSYIMIGGSLMLTPGDFYGNATQVASGVGGDLFMHGPKVGYITAWGGQLKNYDLNTGSTTVVSTVANTFAR